MGWITRQGRYQEAREAVVGQASRAVPPASHRDAEGQSGFALIGLLVVVLMIWGVHGLEVPRWLHFGFSSLFDALFGLGRPGAMLSW